MAPSLHVPRRIADKIILLVILLEALSISLWGGLTYVAARDELMAAIGSRLQEAALRTQAEIGEFFNPVLNRAFTLNEAAETLNLDTGAQRQLFSRFQRSRKELDSLSILDKEGRLLFRVGGQQPVEQEEIGTVVGYAPLVNEALRGRIATSGIVFNEQKNPLVRLATPLGSDKNEGVGALLLVANLKWLWNVVGQQSVGRTGNVCVLDERLRLIAHQDPRHVRTQSRSGHSIFPPELFSNGGGALLRYSNLNGDSVTGLALFDPKLKWWTVVELPVEEGLAPLDRVVWRFVAALVLAITLTVILVTFFSRRIMRPLEDLESAALHLAGGSIGTRVPVPDNSELTGLARAFNHMADSLEDTIEQLSRQQERAEVTLHSISDGVITTDAFGHVREMNITAEKLTGWPHNEARGRPLAEIYHIRREGSTQLVEPPVGRVLSGEKIDGFTNHTELLGSDGAIHAIEERAAPIADRAGRVIGVVLVFRDVSEKRELLKQLAYQADHDPLTGLANRRLFQQRLEHLITDARDTGRVHALLYLDLDQFKLINDTCGHLAGDEVLRQLPTLWSDALGPESTLARIGGDEFGILLENCVSLERAVAVSEAVREIVTDYRFVWSGRSFALGASLGVAMIDTTATDAASLLAAADTACLAAKEQGRNRVWVYALSDKEVARQVNEREWVQRIREALAEERFELHYQDIVPVRPGQGGAPHVELLVRMVNEAGELEMPGSFIPTAEHYGLMPQLDRLVIKKALNWLAGRDETVICSINLSGLSLSDEALLAYIRRQFEATGADPERVCFEITETAAISQLARADRLIGELKRLGCQFSLDDFGSGLSSFRYLKHLPVDFLKIDGAFVRDMVKDETDRAMVESIHHLARQLDIRTVAEFVENQTIFTQLLAIGVHYAQGYAISRPRPLAEYVPSRFGL